MLTKNNKSLSIKFLKCLSKIKGWNYHEKIEVEKRNEIRDFISMYVLENVNGRNILHRKISYYHLHFLIEHPSFKPTINALLILLEPSVNEKEFDERYQRVTSKQVEVSQLT